MEYVAREAKSLLRLMKGYEDSWFWSAGSLNAFRGCEHDCAYCDGKAERYYVDDFSGQVIVKINAPVLLDKELSRLGFRPHCRPGHKKLDEFLPGAVSDGSTQTYRGPPKFVVGLCGGVSDAYQQGEREFKVTRKLMRVLRDYGFPVFILTKSDLVLRDLDLLGEINKETNADVSFTITLADDETQAVYEHGASSTTERFQALRQLREEGIQGGVYATPLLPYIGDTHDNIEALVRAAKDAKAQFVVFGGLTLRPGRQKDEFLSILASHTPELVQRYERLYRRNLRSGEPEFMELMHGALIGHKYCRRYGILDRKPRYVPPGRIAENLLAAEHLYYLEHVRGMLLGDSASARMLRYAARALDALQEPFSLLSDSELVRRTSMPNDVAQIVREFQKRGGSHALDEALQQVDETGKLF